jgi:hypothetical protein
MANRRTKKPAATKIEELPQPQVELTPEQAEAVEGGLILVHLSSPVLQEDQAIGSGVLKPDEPKPKPKLPIDVIAPIGVP